jgi:hypothetical protein
VQTHGESLHNDDLKTLYENMGQIVSTIYSPLTPELLAEYDIIIVGEDWNNVPWSSSEIEATRDFIRSGKGFIGVGDELAASAMQILGEYGIQYTGMWADYGSSSNFDHSHPLMNGVNYIYASGPVNSLRTTSPGYWIANDRSNTHVLIAGAEADGTVLCMSDDFAADLNYEDNRIMFANVIDWMATKYDHDLLATLGAPRFLEPGSLSLLNATVRNRGLSNETDVDLWLLVNDTILDSVTIPELLVGSSYTLTYLWTPDTEGTYNTTVYVPPVPNENFTANNVVTRYVEVRFTIAIAILNSFEIPPYFDGGWSNNYQLLVDALNAQGFYAEAVTNERIIAGDLRFFDVFVMVDNVPNEAAIPYVVAFWSEGGGLVSFDSSICFLNYAGVLPPESAGSNGFYTYWDYETSNQAKISVEHPLTEGYEVGEIVYGMSGDALYWADALASSVSYPYYTTIVEDLTRSDRAYVSAYEPPVVGKVVQIWDQDHWGNANLQRMIINAMSWVGRALIPGLHDIAVTSLDVWPIDVYTGWMVYANVTVENLGNVSAYFTVSLYYDDNLITTENADALQPNETVTLNIIWDTSFVAASHNYTITAVATTKGETEIGNNRLTVGPVQVRIIGDANGDGRIDIFDCILASNAFGASSSEPEYQVFCDVNQDGLIDIFDMIQFAIHFGEEY